MKYVDHLNSSDTHSGPERIAEGNIAAVDLCDCGMMHVHIGALTLRLDSSAVRDLITTLGHAVAEQTAATYRRRALGEKRRGHA
ncbi:MAG: hypothetical protein ACOY0T_28880 [Myxococcota bacterium]